MSWVKGGVIKRTFEAKSVVDDLWVQVRKNKRKLEGYYGLIVGGCQLSVACPELVEGSVVGCRFLVLGSWLLILCT